MNYLRDSVQFPISSDYFQQRLAAGWRLHVIEWEKDDQVENREAPDAQATIPYGLEIVSKSSQLTQNQREIAVLLTILEMIVKDRGVPEIANELNRRSYKTRSGISWNAPAVFDLLPRVIEMGPTLLRSPEWISLRPAAIRRAESGGRRAESE